MDIFKTDMDLIFFLGGGGGRLSRDNCILQNLNLMHAISQLVMKDFSSVISQWPEDILIISQALKSDLVS